MNATIHLVKPTRPPTLYRKLTCQVQTFLGCKLVTVRAHLLATWRSNIIVSQ